MINKQPITGSPGGRTSLDGTYIGIVKNAQDVQKMGRLQVWIPEMGGDPQQAKNWFTVSYCSPFAGTSNIANNVKDSDQLSGTQTSYGWWSVPPDVNNEVVVCFINGDPTRGIWIGCLYAQNMNHMVPAIASDIPSSGPQEFCGGLPPVAEYNKFKSSVTPPDPPRPVFTPLSDGIGAQGLYKDQLRGPSNTSARRESPSQVFGFKSPRGQVFAIDDDSTNEFIRFRTRSGTQILIHETSGFVYINSKLGNSWLEISDDGIDMYSRFAVSIRAGSDINLRADGNVNIDAGGSINQKSGADNTTNSGGTIVELSTGNNIRKAPFIQDNPKTVPTVPTPINQNDMTPTDGNFCGVTASVQSIVSRMPSHEPWSGHAKPGIQRTNASTPPPQYKATIKAGATTDRPSAFKNTPGQGTVNSPSKREVKTGSGGKALVSSVDLSGQTVNIGNRKVPVEVQQAIKNASDKTGVDYGYLMSIAEQESGFNPNAKAGTSSASGLFQFTDQTWGGMVAKYGAENNITLADKNDPEANALMGALYTKENQAALTKSLGRDPTDTDLYMAHFLGTGGSKQFLKADPNSLAISNVSSGAASANQSIFYNSKDGGQPRTTQEVYDLFARKIEPKANAYNAAAKAG